VDYVVDGIVDNLITDLATHLPGSFIISRSTAFAYKGRSAAIRQVGKELGVRYVLEGAVSAGPSHLRVSVQLINAETDEHLWAERFDKERRDIRQLQEEIVGRLSRSVGIEMVRTEAVRGNAAGIPDAVDLVMRARAQTNEIKRAENVTRVVELFRQALKSDPDNVDALVGIATMCTYQVLNMSGSVSGMRSWPKPKVASSRRRAGTRPFWCAEGAGTCPEGARPVLGSHDRYRESDRPQSGRAVLLQGDEAEQTVHRRDG
jgi:TolB-like protein